MFFKSFFNIVFIPAPIKTTFKKANNFKNDDPTSLTRDQDHFCAPSPAPGSTYALQTNSYLCHIFYIHRFFLNTKGNWTKF